MQGSPMIHTVSARRSLAAMAMCLAIVLPAGVAGAQTEPAYEAVPTASLPLDKGLVPPAGWPAQVYLPAGSRVTSISVSGDTATIKFSPEILSQLDEGTLIFLADQFRMLFYDLPEIRSVRLTCKSKLLSSFLPSPEPVVPAPAEALQAAPEMTVQALTTTGLSGKKICIGPSHGRLWNGTAWGWQRGDDCGFGIDSIEDVNSIRLMQFLSQYLAQDGATVYVPRQLDETDCCNPGENRYWYQLAAYSWIRHLGLPCAVWASNTGNCTSDTGSNRINDDIRARPLFADYYNTDIYISHHTNAYNGVASGTVTFYDTAMEHPAHEAASQVLAQEVQSHVCDVIKNVYGISDWYNRGAQDSAGAYGEIRIPDRPACLIELAFHDQCQRDAIFLQDNWFRSLTQWAIYKAVCDYFAVTPTWDMYSCELIGDTIPANMTPGQTCNVTVTYRNRGVLWTNARSFKLGAVGDSDPFTAFNRVALAAEVRPGDTYVFTFTMTAPTTPNIYTTDWRMVRDGVAWFGPTVTRQVTVGSGPFPPSITLQPVSQSIAAGGSAAFTIEAIGTDPLTYQWQKNGVNLSNGGHYSGCTTTTLTVSNADAADAADYRCVVTNAQGNATSNAATLTVQVAPVVFIVESRTGGQNYAQYSETGTWSNSTAKSVAAGCTSGIGSRYCTIGTSAGTAVFRFTPPATGSYQVFTTNCNTSNSGNPMIHTVTHAGGSASVSVCQNSTCSPNACDNWYPLGTFTLNANTEYSVTLNGFTSAGSAPSGNAGRSDAVKWESVSTGSAPTITQQPTNQSVTTGGTASFTVAASGTAPLTYQWQKNQGNIADGGHYSGCSTATLTITGADGNDAANYRCIVTNAYGNATSNEASLTVNAPTSTEFRGFWADVWGVGYKTTADINDMVNRAVQGRYNVIYPEILAYHDNASSAHGAYWNSSIVPKAPDIEAGLDPLAYLCQQAHAQGIQVHAWIVPFRVSLAWPPAGNTTLSAHGEYVMVPRANTGGGPTGIGSPATYYLDPGSPDVQEYVLSIVRELVTNYPIDGVQFDYIRYVQADAGYPSSSSYYNSGLKRFQRITGRSDTPAATGDAAWDDFRRRGITELVRRARAEIPGLTNPRQPVRFSTAVVTWGDAPSSFQGSGAWSMFCNWEEWQRLAFIDTCCPMTYYAESSYPTWYRNWVDKEMTWRYNRHMVVGPGIYLNTFAQSVTQIQYARSKGADGVCTYDYRETRSDTGSVWDWYPYVAANCFTGVAAVPAMTWRNSGTATEGTLWGRVTDAATGNPIDDATVQVGAMDPVKTDANGYYVVTLITATGSGTNYTVVAGKTGYANNSQSATVVAGEVRRQDFSMVVGGNPPTITGHPAGVAAVLGSSAGFAVQATGSAPLTYQWQKNQTNLSNGGHYFGCTTAVLVVSGIDGNDLANYRCVVTNSYGSAASNEAALTTGSLVDSYIVESRSGGLNYAQYAETGTWANSTAKSTASGCTAGIGSRYCTIGTSAGTALFKFTPSTTGSYEVFTTNCSTTNSGNPLVHSVAFVNGVSNRGVCQNTTCSPSAVNVWLSLGTYALTAGTEYTVTLNGSTGVGSAPSGNAGRSDAVKWCRVGIAPPTITQQPTAQAVCAGGTATFTVAASGGGTLTYQWQKNQANLSNGGHYSGVNTATLTVSNADSGDVAGYRCVVTNAGGSTNSNEAALTLKTATAITAHPAAQNVCPAGTATFTVTAAGDGTLTYQWQKNAVNLSNGGHYSGCTTATLTVSSCDGSDAANYRCVVTGGCGSATSNQAALTLKAATTITAHPAAQSVCPGSTATFTVTAAGDGTLTYQWQKNQANLSNGGHYSGVTTATLTVSSADSGDAANYRCVVTGGCGSATSNEAALTVKAATTITAHPQNQTVAAGGTATFTVAATGDGTLTYQWQKNSVNLSNGGHYSGCTTATLTVSSCDSNDAADYRCVVTGGCGTATSNQATLTVTTIQTIINDNFDSYANQTAFQTAWPAAATTLTLSTTQYYSSPKSIYSANDATARSNKKTFTEMYATDASPITLTWRMYDSGAGGTMNQWVELRDYAPTAKQLIQFGIYGGCSTTKYSARVAYSPGNGWVATTVNRAAGWHEFKVVIKSTTMDFYVDGVLASANRTYASSQGSVSWEEIRVGSGYASSGVYAYYDNVLLTKGQ